MFELKSDLARGVSLRQATKEAKEKGVYVPKKTLMEQHAEMLARKKQNKTSKWLWVIVLSIATTLPFLMSGVSSVGDKQMQTLIDSAFEKPVPQYNMHYKEAIRHMKGQDAVVQVKINGTVVEKEVSTEEFENALDEMRDGM